MTDATLAPWTRFLSGTKTRVLILPTGSFEQHGPHLPLWTDTLIAWKLAHKAAENLGNEGVETLVLPPIPYGVSYMWNNNDGTISIRQETFVKYLIDAAVSALRWGTHLVILNGHGGNVDAIKYAAREIVQLSNKPVATINWWELVRDAIKDICETGFFHADECETSVAVYLGIPITGIPRPSPLPFRRKQQEGVHVYMPEHELRHEPGSFGFPNKYSAEKGEKVVKEFVSKFTTFVKDFIKEG